MSPARIVTIQECGTWVGRYPVPSHTRKNETYLVLINGPSGGIACTCPDWHRNSNDSRPGNVNYACKHIKEVLNDHCFWHETMGRNRQTNKQRDAMVCPACGGPTIKARVLR